MASLKSIIPVTLVEGAAPGFTAAHIISVGVSQVLACMVL